MNEQNKSNSSLVTTILDPLFLRTIHLHTWCKPKNTTDEDVTYPHQFFYSELFLKATQPKRRGQHMQHPASFDPWPSSFHCLFNSSLAFCNCPQEMIQFKDLFFHHQIFLHVVSFLLLHYWSNWSTFSAAWIGNGTEFQSWWTQGNIPLCLLEVKMDGFWVGNVTKWYT